MLWILLIGFLVGVVAKFFMPGKDPGGILVTILLGVGGAMLANWAGAAFGIYQPGEPVGFVAAVVECLAKEAKDQRSTKDPPNVQQSLVRTFSIPTG